MKYPSNPNAELQLADGTETPSKFHHEAEDVFAVFSVALTSSGNYVYLYCPCHAILVHITQVNLEDYGTKVETVRDSTKSMYAVQYEF